MIGDLEQQEREVSYQRRHPARQDRHPARRARRAPAELRGAERARPGRRRPPDGDPDREGGAADAMSVVYCSECGFQNPEAANYCSRCGALLAKGEPAAETTQSFSAGGDRRLARSHDDLGARRPGARRPRRRRQGGGELQARPASARASAAPRTARSSSTTSPSRGTTPCSSRATAVHGRGPGLAERHVRQPQAHRQRAA